MSKGPKEGRAMDKKKEREMQTAFDEQAREVLSMPDRFLKDGKDLKVGFESEVAIHSDHLALNELEFVRDNILRKVPDFTDVELGTAQIEFRTPPVNISSTNGFCDISDIYRTTFQRLVLAATESNCSILRIGSNPFLPIKNTPRTNKLKYQLVPDFYNKNRPLQTDTIIGLGNHQINIGDAAVVSLFQSFQVNLEARSFEDACDKMNRSFFIAPYLLALAANSRYLELVDTKMQDLRMIGWEKSHDTLMQDLRLVAWEKAFDLRTPNEIARGHALRVGLPERYFIDLSDYLNRASRFPFILHQPKVALNMAVGMTWLDARVKFIQDSLVVELRLLPTQPKIEEELMLALLYLGRLIDSQMRNESLLPIEFVRENRLSAMLYGMHRKMWFLSGESILQKLPYKLGVRREIKRAICGLERFGLANLLDKELLEKILINGSPSDRLSQELDKKEHDVSVESMKEALARLEMLTKL